jgi:hypothetical protein
VHCSGDACLGKRSDQLLITCAGCLPALLATTPEPQPEAQGDAGLQHEVAAGSSPDEDQDDSVRCRMSGICEGPPPAGTCPANWGAQYELLDAEQRDALLACTWDPAERASRVVEAVTWSWKGYQ